MRFVVSTSELAAAVGAASRSIGYRVTQPAYATIGLEVLDDGTVLCTGTDGDTTTRAVAAVSSSEPGSCAVPGPMLHDLVKDLPEGSVTIESDATTCLVTASSGTYRIPVSADRPVTLDVAANPVVTITGAELAAAVAALSPIAKAADGVFIALKFERVENHLRVASTDRYRLGIVDIAVMGSAADDWAIDALVPVKVLVEAARLFGRSPIVSLGMDEVSFTITNGSASVVTRLTAGVWPQYQALLERQPMGSAIVDAATLMRSVRRVARFSSDAAVPSVVQLTFEDGEIAVTASGSGAANESVPYSGTVVTVTLFVNAQYLLDAVSGAGGDDVTLSPTGVTSGLYVDGDYHHLVMPTRG